MVVDYVDGEPGPGPADGTEFVSQFAHALAEIHRVDPADLSFLPELGKVAADVPLPRRNRSVLLHGDFWPGNTLWKDGRLVAVIDWEDAAIGDPLADVGNARLELAWTLGPEAMDDFTRRYRSVLGDVDFTDLPYWDLRADLRLAGRVAEWGLDAVMEEAMLAAHEAFVAQALETLSAR